MGDTPDLEGWQRYPHNLPSQGCNVYGYDCDAYVEQLDQDTERLFVSGPQICLKIVEFKSEDRREQVLTEPDLLTPYLQDPRPTGVVRVILVPQESSWGKLRITKECILKLFTALQVFPACIDVVQAFGQKTTVRDETYGGFYIQENSDPSYTECAYTVKYPEQHGRDEPLDPWSLRQMGVYYQSYNGGDGTFIIFHPSKPFLKRLKRAMTSKDAVTPWSLHMMALSAAMDNWRWYISDLEKRYTKAKTNTQLSSINNQQPGEYHANITFEDTQDIQVLQDKLSQSLHYLTTNHSIIDQIHNKQAMLARNEKRNQTFIETLMTEASMEMNRVKSILKRAEGTQALAQAILDFTCLESLRSNSRTMTELTRLSRQEAEMLLDLSVKASRDNDILKTLALLGLIYLPATLVSSIMGMDYVKVRKGTGKKLTIVFEKEIWIFIILVAILLVVTLGSYYVWIRHKRAKRLKDLEKLRWRKKHLTLTW